MSDIDPTLDPIMVAALIDDDDDEEGKALTAAFLEQNKATEDDDDEDDTTDEAEDEDDGDEDDTSTDTDKKADDADDDEVEEPAKTADAETVVETEAEKKSRREKRNERRQQYLERISIAPQDDTDVSREPLDDYKPLDLSEGEYDANDLQKDRQQYAQAVAAQAQETQKRIAREENFWTEVKYQSDALVKDPKYSFLSEKSEDFDENKAAKINDLYLKVIGFEEKPVTNAQGYAKLDAQGNVVKQITTRRKDLSYDEFVIGYIENVQEFIDDSEAETTKNLVQQQANQGIRPNGSSRRGMGKLKLGDISKMSDEEFEKNEAEIDRQIAAELGM